MAYGGTRDRWVERKDRALYQLSLGRSSRTALLTTLAVSLTQGRNQDRWGANTSRIAKRDAVTTSVKLVHHDQPLKHPTFGHRNRRPIANNKMDQQPDVHQAQGIAQPPRDVLVCLARFSLTGRVIMRDEHGGCVKCKRPLHNFAWVYRCRVNCAEEQLLEANEAMSRIQEQGGKYLGRVMFELRDEEPCCYVGACESGSPVPGCSQAAPADFVDGLNCSGFCAAQAIQVQQAFKWRA